MSFALWDEFLAAMRKLNPGLTEVDAREAYDILDRFFDDWHAIELKNHSIAAMDIKDNGEKL